MTDTVDKLLRCKKVIEGLNLNSDNVLSIHVDGNYKSIPTIHILPNAIKWTGYVLERRAVNDKFPWRIYITTNSVLVFSILSQEQLMDIQAEE